MEREMQKMDAETSTNLKTDTSNSTQECQASEPGPVENSTVETNQPDQDGPNPSVVHFGTDPGDIIIETGGCRFSCHKHILIQHSLYFQAMFASGMKESQSNEVCLENIASQPFHHLLEYFYTGNLNLSPSNVEEMTQVCSHLQVGVVLDQCCDLLLTMIEDDLCLSLMRLSNLLMLHEVYNQSRRHALWHFPRVYKTEDFTSAPSAQIIDYLQDPHLNIDSEVEVFRAAAVWCCAQEQSWSVTDLQEFFGKVVNFHLATVDDVALMEDLPEVGEHQALKEFVASLRQGDILMGLRSKDPTRVRTSPRNGSMLCVGAHQCSPPACETSCSLISQKLNAPLDVLRFEPDGCSLEHVASMSEHYPPLANDTGYTVCTVGHLVYVVGGEAALGRTGSWLTSIWCLDTLRCSWHEAGTLQNVRRHHGLCAYGATLFLIGGIGRFRVRLASMESFDTETKEWHQLPNMLYQETWPAVTEHRGSIYVLKNYSQVFNIATSSWSYLKLYTPIPGLPIYAHPHPHPTNNSIIVSCFNSESLWLLNLDKQKSKRVAKFEMEGGGGVVYHGRFYHFQLNDLWTESDVHVECYDMEGKSLAQTGVLKRAKLSTHFVTVPRFPRYAPSSNREFC